MIAARSDGTAPDSPHVGQDVAVPLDSLSEVPASRAKHRSQIGPRRIRELAALR